jgi:hypothetical protein
MRSAEAIDMGAFQLSPAPAVQAVVATPKLASAAVAAERTRRLAAHACGVADRRVRQALADLLACDQARLLDPARLRAVAELLDAAAQVAERAHAAHAGPAAPAVPAAPAGGAGVAAAGRPGLVGPGGARRPAALRVVGREPAELPSHPHPASN